MSKVIHMSIDLRGAIMNWEDRMWLNCVTADDGHTMKPQEVKLEFLNALSEGKKVIPVDSSCDNFDYQKGCLGHEHNTATGGCVDDTYPKNERISQDAD